MICSRSDDEYFQTLCISDDSFAGNPGAGNGADLLSASCVFLVWKCISRFRISAAHYLRATLDIFTQ